MDLYAFSNIDNLSEIAKANGIEIPRLRGYRLMRDEEPVSEKEIQEMIREQAIEEAAKLICSNWGEWSWREYSARTNAMKKKYLIYGMVESEFTPGEMYRSEVGIRWDRIHGKHRKKLKWAIRKAEKRIRAQYAMQYAMWNKYAGRDDVLYIHSRMGGDNWRYYEEKESITSQPWFLGRVDDYWDGTYCDFYAKIQPVGHAEVGEGDD